MMQQQSLLQQQLLQQQTLVCHTVNVPYPSYQGHRVLVPIKLQCMELSAQLTLHIDLYCTDMNMMCNTHCFIKSQQLHVGLFEASLVLALDNIPFFILHM